MDLLGLLKQIADNQAGIRLLNSYKGLPITSDATILSAAESEIQVTGSKSHIASLYYQGESYLQSADLPFVIHSEVRKLNLARDYAVLSNFQVAQDNIGKRRQIRVEPDDVLIATVQFKGSPFEFPTALADISASGACVFFESYTFPPRLAQSGNELVMTIAIPDGSVRKPRNVLLKPTTGITTGSLNPEADTEGRVEVVARGKIVSIKPEPKQKRYRVSAQLFFKDLSRMVIMQYISRRQMEIINDLRLLAAELYGSQK